MKRLRLDRHCVKAVEDYLASDERPAFRGGAHCSGHAVRVRPHAAGKAEMTDLTPFFARYPERYMASDVDAISAIYEAPLLALREGRVIHLADRTAVRAHLADVMAGYARSGAARADI